MPVRAKPHQFAIEVDADPAAHAHDHRLAIKGFKTLLEVGHDVLGDERQALFGANDGFQLCPSGLELLLALDLFLPRSLPRTRGQSSAARSRRGPVWPTGFRSRSVPWPGLRPARWMS